MSPKAALPQWGVGLLDTRAVFLLRSIFPDALTGLLLVLPGGLITPSSVISRLHNYPIS